MMRIGGNMTKYNVERWEATKMWQATPAAYEPFSRRGRNKNIFMGKGTIATYLSHVSLMKHISESKQGVYFILEDDILPKFSQWADEAMCQIRELPKDWDVYKFGFFGGAGGKGDCKEIQEAGKFSCFLHKHSFKYMGNQGYALTPKGAAKMLEHLQDMPVMDIDGAMMSGQAWGNQGSKIDANYYVARHTMLQHDQSYGSERMHANGGRAFMDKMAMDCDMAQKQELCLEEYKQNHDNEEGRESSWEAKKRISRHFLKTGKMPWEVASNNKAVGKDWSRMAALV